MALPLAAVWRVHRRPQVKLLIVSMLLALGFGIGGWWLLQALLLESRPLLSIAAGGVVGGGIFVLMWSGASAWVGDDGILRYGFGRRIDLEVPLAATRDWRLVEGGLLRGIGATVDPGAVTLHGRKAASPARMADWRRDIGVDLLLEHLTAEDAAALNALTSTITAAPSEVIVQ